MRANPLRALYFNNGEAKRRDDTKSSANAQLSSKNCAMS